MCCVLCCCVGFLPLVRFRIIGFLMENLSPLCFTKDMLHSIHTLGSSLYSYGTLLLHVYLLLVQQSSPLPLPPSPSLSYYVDELYADFFVAVYSNFNIWIYTNVEVQKQLLFNISEVAKEEKEVCYVFLWHPPFSFMFFRLSRKCLQRNESWIFLETFTGWSQKLARWQWMQSFIPSPRKSSASTLLSVFFYFFFFFLGLSLSTSFPVVLFVVGGGDTKLTFFLSQGNQILKRHAACGSCCWRYWT